MMTLTPITEKFILHWGEMGPKWGVNRTVAQIQALLFLAEEPLNAEDICQILNVARSNVSNSIKELQSMKLIKTVQKIGDRRDYFESTKDVWELVRIIIKERKEHEFEPTIATLQSYVSDPSFSKENTTTQKAIKDTLELMQVTDTWVEEMLRLSPETILNIMRLGTKVQKLIRGAKKAAKKDIETK